VLLFFDVVLFSTLRDLLAVFPWDGMVLSRRPSIIICLEGGLPPLSPNEAHPPFFRSLFFSLQRLDSPSLPISSADLVFATPTSPHFRD